MSVEAPPLLVLSPTLNIVLSWSTNTAHSEYAGIIKLIHLLLINAILTPTAQVAYTTLLKRFSFSPGWACLQSPAFHLSSYHLQEHARWFVIVPCLLQVWLQDSYIKPTFIQALRTVFSSYFRTAGILKPTADVIILAFAAVVKSNMLCIINSLSSQNQRTFSAEVLLTQMMFQQLCEAAALSAKVNFCSCLMTSVMPVLHTCSCQASTSTTASLSDEQAIQSVKVNTVRETIKEVLY